MRIDAWHEELLRTDAAYAAAVAEVEADPREHYADQILALRVRAGLTQAQVAKLAGTTQAVVSRLEAAIGNPKLGTIGKVVRALEDHLAAVPPSLVSIVTGVYAPSWSVVLTPSSASGVIITQGSAPVVSGPVWVSHVATEGLPPLASSAAANADYAEAA